MASSWLFGIAPQAAEQVAQFLANDLGPQRLVGQAVAAQEMLVEEVPERSVPDVVQQAGHAQQRFHVAAAGRVRADFPQAVVQHRHRPAGQVHGPHDVLEPGVFGTGIDPPGGLQLVDVPQPLDPRMVDDLPLGGLALPRRRAEVKGCSRGSGRGRGFRRGAAACRRLCRATGTPSRRG